MSLSNSYKQSETHTGFKMTLFKYVCVCWGVGWGGQGKGVTSGVLPPLWYGDNHTAF